MELNWDSCILPGWFINFQIHDIATEENKRKYIIALNLEMTSLKRQQHTDPYASNIASKVFIRSTRNGKVQKIVRELYLRQDIPCSSKLCSACLENAPANASGIGT